MSQFTPREKAKFILHAIESEHSEAIGTPLARCQKEIGIGRTKLSQLLNSSENTLKDGQKVSGLNEAFSKRVAEPGSYSYRKRFEEITAAIKRRSQHDIDQIDRYYLDLAFDSWAPKAMDEARPVASRLLHGRMAHMIAYNAIKLIPHRRADILIERSSDEIRTMGRGVIDKLVELLGKHRDPPDGLFDENSTNTAKQWGYRVFRSRVLLDQIGWHIEPTTSDIARVELFARAFESRLHVDAMWLHSILGDNEIAWINGAWNLAMHAGAWSTSVSYAVKLFGAFPQFLTEQVMGLTSVCNDRTVWPGIAAIMADRDCSDLDAVRETLHRQSPKTEKMMTSVLKMIDGIRANDNYMQVLEMGASR